MRVQGVEKEGGFTLIELLVVIAIIGVLASIAIPQYSNYKANAFDRRAWADLANVALAEAAYFADQNSYVACDHTSCPSDLPGLGPLSAGVLLEVNVSGDSFVATATHPSGSGQVYTWNQ